MKIGYLGEAKQLADRLNDYRELIEFSRNHQAQVRVTLNGILQIQDRCIPGDSAEAQMIRDGLISWLKKKAAELEKQLVKLGVET